MTSPFCELSEIFKMHTIKFYLKHNDKSFCVLFCSCKALQRILGYMNATDGSMKMFRDDSTPSLW